MSALLGACCLIWAQAETGQIAGIVVDPAGATVANAEVTVTNTQNGSERKSVTSGTGDLVVTNLLPGPYRVTVESPGFSTYKQEVVVAVGSKIGLDVKLQLGSTGTTIEVSTTAVQVNVETQTLSTVVSQKQLNELPTLTRNPYALVAMSGNVSDDNVGKRGVGFAVNGQRAESTNFLLDGAANNDEFAATVGQAVPLDSVQEFSIFTNDFTAEYGRAGAGVVNVVTKSGTNSFSGTAYESTVSRPYPRTPSRRMPSRFLNRFLPGISSDVRWAAPSKKTNSSFSVAASGFVSAAPLSKRSGCLLLNA